MCVTEECSSLKNYTLHVSLLCPCFLCPGPGRDPGDCKDRAVGRGLLHLHQLCEQAQLLCRRRDCHYRSPWQVQIQMVWLVYFSEEMCKLQVEIPEKQQLSYKSLLDHCLLSLQNHVPAGLHTKRWPSLPGRQRAQHCQLLAAGLRPGVPDCRNEEGLSNGGQGAAHNS